MNRLKVIAIRRVKVRPAGDVCAVRTTREKNPLAMPSPRVAASSARVEL